MPSHTYTQILRRTETKLSSQANRELHMSEKCILMWNRSECKLLENGTIKNYLRRVSRQFAWGTIRQNLLSNTVKKKQNQDREWECLQSPGIKQGLECCTPLSNPTARWEKFWLRERKSLQPLKSLDPCLRLAPGFEHAPSSSWKWW